MRSLKKSIWPAKIVIDEDISHSKHVEIEHWLGENFGAFKGRWNHVPKHNCVDYYFRSSKDATMFSLRWL